MKPIIQKIGLLAAMLLTVLSASAYHFVVNGLCYNILSKEDRTVEVTYYTNSDNSSYVSGDLVIPQRILYSGKTYKVTAIGAGAFHNCSGLTSVEIPNSVTEIGMDAFGSCSNLTDINVSEENTSYRSIDGVLYTKDASLLIECGEGKKGTVTIPNSVTQIGSSAFWYCSGLTSVTIPNSVTEIGKIAFEHCSSLTSVEIPNSVTKIGDGAFYCCSGLISVEIPNSVTEIGHGAFKSCSCLTSVEIPNSVTKIGSTAFRPCN